MPDTTPNGMAPVFAGWNVWSLYQSTDPDDSFFDAAMHIGLGLDRLLQIWVEDKIKTEAPGTAVADPANPAALRGDQIQIIPSPGTLPVLLNRLEQAPELAGVTHLGKPDASGTLQLRFVRFFNRGAPSVLPWPHDQNYLLESVYQPSAQNPLTNSPAPSSLGGAASDAAAAIGHGLETLAWVAGGAAALLLLVQLTRSR